MYDNPEDIATGDIIHKTEDVEVEGDEPCPHCARILIHRTTCPIYTSERLEILTRAWYEAETGGTVTPQ